jgi:hypothetical protein
LLGRPGKARRECGPSREKKRRGFAAGLGPRKKEGEVVWAAAVGPERKGGKSWAGFKWRKREDVGRVLKGILTIKIREIPRFTHSRTYSNLKSQTHFSHKKYYALQHECNRQKIIT